MWEPETSSARALIEGLQARGAVLWRKDGNVHFRAPRGLLTPEVLLRIRERKVEILPLLPDGPSSDAISIAKTPNVVLLDTGCTSQPVFCVHPIDGSAASYLDLARELASRGASTYGLSALDLHGKKYIPDSLRSIAARYVEQLKHTQKGAPYRLVGWSAGAVIAYEMACELVRKYNEVAELTLLDPPAFFVPAAQQIIELPPGHRDLPLSTAQQESARIWWRFLKLNAASPDEYGSYGISTNFWTLDDIGKSRYLLDNRNNPQVIKPDNLFRAARDADDVLYMFHMVNIQHSALEDYKPSSYPGAINLFIAIDAEAPTEMATECLRWATAMWRRRVGAIAHSEWLPGGHIALVKPPHVATVARTILRNR
jgi:thioesterase domain-containing protein